MDLRLKELIENKKWLDGLDYLKQHQKRLAYSANEKQALTIALLQQIALEQIQKNELDRAEKTLKKWYKLTKEKPAVFLHLASVYKKQGNFEKSYAILKEGLSIHPLNDALLSDLGSTEQDRGHDDQAFILLEKAMSINPHNPITHYNLGLLKLLHGDYEAGFQYCESRYQIKGFSPQYWDCFQEKYYRGQDLSNKKVLIVEEQGFGDTILCARFIEHFKKQGAEIILCCRETLHTLFKDALAIDKIIPTHHTLPEFDYLVPMMSMAYMLGIKQSMIKGTPYLKATRDPSHQSLFHPDRLNVALVWSGNPNFYLKKRKNCPPEQLLPLFDLDKIHFYGLQLSESCEIFSHTRKFTDLSEYMHDFSKTASLLLHLDLVITVDTAMAHLAGALGIPSFVLVYHPPAWVWGKDGDKSQWYQSAKLFRQSKTGNWTLAIKSMLNELKSMQNT